MLTPYDSIFICCLVVSCRKPNVIYWIRNHIFWQDLNTKSCLRGLPGEVLRSERPLICRSIVTFDSSNSHLVLHKLISISYHYVHIRYFIFNLIVSHLYWSLYECCAMCIALSLQCKIINWIWLVSLILI